MIRDLEFPLALGIVPHEELPRVLGVAFLEHNDPKVVGQVAVKGGAGENPVEVIDKALPLFDRHHSPVHVDYGLVATHPPLVLGSESRLEQSIKQLGNVFVGAIGSSILRKVSKRYSNLLID